MKARAKTPAGFKPKRSKAEPTPQWQKDWEEWWEYEHGPAWEHEGWDCNGKHWDGYAWASSKLDMHNLDVKEVADGPESKRSRGGEEGNQQDEVESDPKNEAAQEESAEQSVGNGTEKKKSRKLESKVESEPKKPKKMKEEVVQQACEDEVASEQTEWQATKAGDQKQSKRGKKPSHTIDLPHPLPGTRADQIEAFVEFGQRFAKLKVKNPFRQSVKDELSTFVTCRLNIYWTRKAVGITDAKSGKDFAYFAFGDYKLKYQQQMAITVKTAELFATGRVIEFDRWPEARVVDNLL